MTAYAIKPGVAQQSVGDVRLLMDSHAGRYLELNASGALIFDALLQNTPPAAIAEQLLQVFAVEHAQALADVESLTQALLAQGIIEVRNTAE